MEICKKDPEISELAKRVIARQKSRLAEIKTA
jgi:hypothetical protein